MNDPMSAPAATLTLVLNRCAGGFRLSRAAALALAGRKGLELYPPVPGEDFLAVRGRDVPIEECIHRDDPDLVAVVRGMGAAANGPCSDLRVVEVPVHVEIDGHDGLEEVNVYGGGFRA